MISCFEETGATRGIKTPRARRAAKNKQRGFFRGADGWAYFVEQEYAGVGNCGGGVFVI